MNRSPLSVERLRRHLYERPSSVAPRRRPWQEVSVCADVQMRLTTDARACGDLGFAFARRLEAPL
jgi:hypothetical protein